jgi:hypothetical protein
MTTDDVGVDGTGPATYETTAITAGTPGGSDTLKLCWGPNPSGTAASEYPLEVGTADLTGPTITAFDCTLSTACTYTISGHNLAATNKIVIVNGACGDDAEVHFGNSVGPTDVDYTVYEFSAFTQKNLEPLADGASHSICWGHEPNSIAEQNVPVATNPMVRGPTLSDFACVINGATCDYVISGTGLATTNRIYLGSEGIECGTSMFSPCNAKFGSTCDNDEPVVNVDGTEETISLGNALDAALTAGTYTMCWGDIDPVTDTTPNLRKAKMTVRIDATGRICSSGIEIEQCN